MISIIIPVYNSAKYLEKTINSVINQTYVDWEIVLIDDGSTDDSYEVCQELANKNKKIHVYHQENAGVSEARNKGISLSQGKYISFLDSDDEISPNFLQIMKNVMEEKKADIVFCGLRRICGETIVEQLYEDEIYNRDEYYFAIYNKMKFKTRSSCTALYRRDIIVKNGILFPINLVCGEDSFFVNKYISFCTKIVTTSKCYYDYINQNPNSATKSYFFNHYLLEYNLYREIYKACTDKDEFIANTGQRYIDILIREMLNFVTYSEERFVQKLKQINMLIKDELTQKACCYYKVESKKHSRLIPWTIRKKLSIVAYPAIKFRSISIGYKVKNARVRSIWK